MRVTNEELREANAHLGRASSELDTFIYAASHNLRLPIANLPVLVRGLIEQLPPRPSKRLCLHPSWV